MLSGLKDESYYLLMAYHGFWFIPKFVLNFLYNRFKKNSRWELYVFTYILEKLLVFRGFAITQYALITATRLKQRGIIWVIGKIFSKAKTKITRSIASTSSGSVSVIKEVIYKRN